MPALLKRMSIRPNRSSDLGDGPVDILGLGHVGGDDQGRRRPPRLGDRARPPGDFASLRPTTTIGPRPAASPRAMPRPIPPLPPVTMATLPVKSKRLTRSPCPALGLASGWPRRGLPNCGSGGPHNGGRVVVSSSAWRVHE